jgi:hypothetical protein
VWRGGSEPAVACAMEVGWSGELETGGEFPVLFVIGEIESSRSMGDIVLAAVPTKAEVAEAMYLRDPEGRGGF